MAESFKEMLEENDKERERARKAIDELLKHHSLWAVISVIKEIEGEMILEALDRKTTKEALIEVQSKIDGPNKRR